MAGAVEERSLDSDLGDDRPGSRPPLSSQAPSAGRQVLGLTFFCITSCQLMPRKNLCSMTSLASPGPPPSLRRDGHECSPPGAAGSGARASAAGPKQPLTILSQPRATSPQRRKPRLRVGAHVPRVRARRQQWTPTQNGSREGGLSRRHFPSWLFHKQLGHPGPPCSLVSP